MSAQKQLKPPHISQPNLTSHLYQRCAIGPHITSHHYQLFLFKPRSARSGSSSQSAWKYWQPGKTFSQSLSLWLSSSWLLVWEDGIEPGASPSPPPSSSSSPPSLSGRCWWPRWWTTTCWPGPSCQLPLLRLFCQHASAIKNPQNWKKDSHYKIISNLFQNITNTMVFFHCLLFFF